MTHNGGVNDERAPYAGLTPDCVLDALESVGHRGDGRLLALNSYENRVYRCVDRRMRRRSSRSSTAPSAGPTRRSSRSTRFVAELAEREIPVVAPLARRSRRHARCSATAASASRCIPRSRRPRARARGSRRPSNGWAASSAASTLSERSALCGAARPRRRKLRRRAARLAARATSSSRPDLRACLVGRPSRMALDRRARLRDAGRATCSVLRLHGDCHAGNVLWTDGGTAFRRFRRRAHGPGGAGPVDAPRPATARTMSAQLARACSRGYERLPRRSTAASCIWSRRCARCACIHYSAWIARRWDDPAFPAAFPWFNTQRYWQDRILELREQIALMDEPPI